MLRKSVKHMCNNFEYVSSSYFDKTNQNRVTSFLVNRALQNDVRSTNSGKPEKKQLHNNIGIVRCHFYTIHVILTASLL